MDPVTANLYINTGSKEVGNLFSPAFGLMVYSLLSGSEEGVDARLELNSTVSTVTGWSRLSRSA
jgi:hypothetical protein